jgi:hypothetical protein
VVVVSSVLVAVWARMGAHCVLPLARKDMKVTAVGAPSAADVCGMAASACTPCNAGSVLRACTDCAACCLPAAAVLLPLLWPGGTCSTRCHCCAR